MSTSKPATKRAVKRPAKSIATAASERAANQSFTIAGVVVSAEGKPLVGLRVEAFDADQSRSTLLGATTSGLRGEYFIQFLETAFRRTPAEKGGPDLFIRVLDASGRMLFESPRYANAQPRQRIDAIIPLSGTSTLAGHYSVIGRVTSPDLPSFAGLTAVIVEFQVGESKDLAPATVDRDGRFLATFELPARKGRDLPDLLVEVRDGKQVLGRSEVVIDAQPGRVTIDVALPGRIKRSTSEFDAVRTKLEGIFGARSERVNDDAFFEKLGYAAAKSGWDARALAMARLALKYEASAGKKAPLAADLFYALFRAGVPGSEGAPFRVPHQVAAAIWTNAARDGVISSLSSKQIADAERRFAEAAVEGALKVQPAPGTSSLGDLLTVSLGDDEAAKRTVARLIGTHGKDTAKLWEEVGSALGAKKRDRLKRDAALAELTLGNASIVSKLAKVLPADASNDTLALNGFGRPETWADFVADADVPDAIEEGATAAGRARYQEFLAAQVRLAHPVAALAVDVTDKKQKFPVKETTKQGVADFLIKNRNGYRLGEEPLEHYLAKNQIEIDEDVRSEVKKIERVYQFTESDAQMHALLAAGIHSGLQVVQYTPSQFVTTFAPALGGEASARKVFGKAFEIQATLTNVAISYQAAQSGITIGPASAPLVQSHASEQDLVAANAGANVALKSMFGELDYCACEHCRSILSPAAYFVNLLQLCESKETLLGGKVHPIDELAMRRPDLLQLPLTCENTNTLVPHIDLVNETLEYFVDSVDDASQPKPALSLDKFGGYSTDPAVPKAELITEPRNVRASAYTKLADAKFPLALPFNQSLESLRQYLKPFGLTLARAMEAVRVDDTPERPDEQSFAWSDILLEELEFSRTEYTLLTDRSKSIRELYGFPPAGGGDPAVPQELRNAGAFARRVGISYEELTRVLQTRFVNPNSWVLPLASRLGVTLGQIKTFKATAPTAENDGDFEKQLSAGIDPAPYGGPVTGWIRNNADSILGLLTLYDTAAEPDPCDFSQKEFRYGDPAANNAKVRDIEFIRLLRFIRIWKKLKWPAESPDDPPVGWTIEEVDSVLTALYPMAYLPLDASEATNLQRLDDGCKILLRRLGALRRLSRLLEVSNAADLGALLACVAPMQGVGPGTLYQRLFLSTGFLRDFPAFALDASARPLGDGSAQVTAAASALQAAFQLTAGDFDRIVVDVGSKLDATLVPQSAAGLQPPSTVLRDKLLELAQATGLASLPKPELLQELLGRQPTQPETQYLERYLRSESVSRIFRRAWLARRLRITVEELLALCRYTGLGIEAEIGAIDSAAPPTASKR